MSSCALSSTLLLVLKTDIEYAATSVQKKYRVYCEWFSYEWYILYTNRVKGQEQDCFNETWYFLFLRL